MIDLLYVGLIAFGLLLDHTVLWPRFQRRAVIDPAPARWQLWTSWMAMLWGLTLAGLALWAWQDRGWDALRLTLPDGWRLGLGLGAVALVAMLQGASILHIARLPAGRTVRFGSRQDEMAPLLPHTAGEFGGFVALSLSAGLCEEFIFRGYLIWAFGTVLGLWPAAIASVVVFALAHAYQGLRGIVGTGLVGAALTALVLVTGSLWPAVVVHALMDIGQGWIAWLVLRRRCGSDSDIQSSPGG